MTDTIFALSSGALPAGIAVVRCSGSLAHSLLAQLVGDLPPARQMVLRSLRSEDGGLIDRAMVVRFDGPATATGEDLVEFHLHGSRAVVARLLAVLGATAGVREAGPGEFTRRALGNGRLDLTEAEGLADLLAAETEWQRRASIGAAGGALRARIEAWRTRLVGLSAQAEAAIDYVDEDETTPDLTHLVGGALALRDEWGAYLAAPTSEKLHDGFRIVLAGPPNAGKSSLFNALIGEDKAIVTPVAGTTRDTLEARLDWGGAPVTLVDTAGLRESDDAIEQIGVARARTAQRDADLLLWLDDDPPPRDSLWVFPRCDERPDAPVDRICVSAKTGEGLQQLRTMVTSRLEDLAPAPDASALSRRQRDLMSTAQAALETVAGNDLVLLAESLRAALFALDRLSGRQSTDDVLDALFGRFCLGK